jgi:hypothetical protein
MRKSSSTIKYDPNARINSSFTRKIQRLNLDPVRYYEGRPVDADSIPTLKGARLA